MGIYSPNIMVSLNQEVVAGRMSQEALNDKISAIAAKGGISRSELDAAIEGLDTLAANGEISRPDHVIETIQAVMDQAPAAPTPVYEAQNQNDKVEGSGYSETEATRMYATAQQGRAPDLPETFKAAHNDGPAFVPPTLDIAPALNGQYHPDSNMTFNLGSP